MQINIKSFILFFLQFYPSVVLLSLASSTREINMDFVTQITLGVCIAEAFFRRRLGKNALWFGGFCGIFPDLDLLILGTSSFTALQSHRGITHSLLFLPIISLVLAAI